ncbi:MAG: YicC family protein [Bdellovibrionales bacterium]|nr:YicC family protein [Bdellovibrionales bacterium]
MNSMTGYGTSQIKNRQLELETHVKSVNGRFLEVRFHLPKEYAPFENDLRKVFASWARGTVDVYVHRRPAAETRLQTVKVREQNAQHWNKVLRSLSKKLGLKQEISLRDILNMPYVMESQDRVSLMPGELKLVEKQLRQAVERCEKLRASEGAVLKKELLSQIKRLENRIGDMEGWREEAMKSAHQRLKSRLATLEAEQLDASRLALETALMIDKMDVHEEVVRLKEHIKACTKLIQSGEARGKKLDFYCQELLREVNTIGSKSQLASLTQVVVDAKSIIEKFREQVQNIE